MQDETAASLREKIQKGTKNIPWKQRDKEIIAGYFIRLFELDPDSLSDREREEAGKYCKTACFAALFGTSSLEYIPIYGRYALTIDTTGKDPFLESDCLRVEAMAAIRLGKEGGKQLRRALRLVRGKRRELQTGSNTTSLNNDIVDKIISTLTWLSRHYMVQERPLRALSLCNLCISLLESRNRRSSRRSRGKTQSRIKLQLLKASLLHAIGQTEAAASLILTEVPADTRPSYCVRAAELLHNSRLQESALPYLNTAAAYYSKKNRDHYEEALSLQSILLERAIRKKNDAAVELAYRSGIQNLLSRQRNFTLPENMDALLGESGRFYGHMIAYKISNNDFSGAIQAVQDSYWAPPSAGGAAPERDVRLKTGALNRERRLKTDKKTDMLPWMHDATDFILFHVDGDRIFRLSRISGEEKSRVIQWKKNVLQREIHGLLSLSTNPRRLPSLFKASVADFKEKLFAGIDARLNENHTITITANAPLSSLPWPLFSPEAHLLLRPGNSRQMRGEEQKQSHLLTLTEDGGTLPMASREQNLLKELFPEGSHITAAPETKKAFLDTLRRCSTFHFAGHGYEHSGYPEKSGLVLKGVPPDITPESLISFQEIRTLDLSNIQLAFLNSCSSGKGHDYSGGIQISAASAFLEAGVKNLIVSCNPVLDNNSLLFTRALYQTMISHPLPPEKLFYTVHRAVPDFSAPYLFICA